MKKLVLFILTLFCINVASSANAMEIEGLLDQALSLQKSGDKAGLEKTLNLSAVALEKETKESKGDFKDKLTSSLGGLKSMIPLASKGLVKQNALQKLVSTIKLLLGANRISGMLGGGSLVGKAAGLKSNLGLMQMGMSALGGGGGRDQMGSLIKGALGGVGNLEKGGLAAKAAEPALKKQLGSILDMVKKGV